jgi:hypothetical protein
MDPVTAMLIMGGLNAGMGAMKAQQAAKQRQSEANLRAAEIEASPWTGKQASTQIQTASPSVWADMLGGAVSGIGQAQALQNAGLFNTPGNPTAPQMMVGDVEAPTSVLMPQRNPQMQGLWGNMVDPRILTA